MLRRSSNAVRAVVAAALLALPYGGGPAGDEPVESKLVEKATSRLGQLDVSVTGPETVISNLGPDDFELRVGGRYIEKLIVDRVCRSPAAAAGAAEGEPTREKASSPAPAPAPAQTPATVVFYFDQPHLTMRGYHRAVELARGMVDTLFDGTTRGMVVYSGRTLEILADMTDDPAKIRAALDRVASDRTMFDPFAMLEDGRIESVMDEIQKVGTDAALALAKRYQAEDRWRAERSLQRISMILGRLADLDPPKAFVYFGDTLRANPGQHYVALFSRSLTGEHESPSVTAMDTRAELEGLTFDGVYDEASAVGVRFYPVQAQGLPGEAATSRPLPNTRWRDAESTLSAFALETGGQAFLGGVSAKKIVSRIEEDLSCLYLVSFDVAGLPLDQPLPVRLTTKREGVRLQTRGRLVIQSEAARRTQRLLAAFATATDGSDSALAGAVVPADYADGRFRALVQVTIPGTEVPGATWDIGASLVASGRVRDDGAERITAATPGVRVVFEKIMEFPPGPYELHAVAHESVTDRTFSSLIPGVWPNPDDVSASVSSIAVLQPDDAAFVRDGVLEKSGALARSGDDPIRVERPTAFLALVCRGPGRGRRLRVERTLSGEAEVGFDPIEMDLRKNRCAQVRDLVRARTLGPGRFVFAVRVLDGKTPVAEQSVTFDAVGEPGDGRASGDG